MSRLVAVHYTATPRPGGLELVSWEMAAHAHVLNKAGVLVTGTPGAPDLDRHLSRIVIPELGTDLAVNQQIFDSFRRGLKHPALDSMTDYLHSALSGALQPGDVVVYFNLFTLPYNVSLTAAAWQLARERTDVTHIAWSFDLCHGSPQFDWRARCSWPWSMFWTRCPNVTYACPTSASALDLSRAIGMPMDLVRIIPPGLDPWRALRADADGMHDALEQAVSRAGTVVVVPARMCKRKNLKRAVDVAASLGALDANCHMIITGSLGGHDETADTQLADLQAYVAERQLQDSISIASALPGMSGRVSRDATTSLIGISDVVLLTSVQEGFLLPILEAALYRAPVVVPRLPAVDWASSVARLYEPDADSSVVATLVLEAAAQPAGKAHRFARTHYSWQNILTTHFAELLNGAEVRRPIHS
jgi:glycosyltransferase involved in cell wall biosynthesis